MKLTLLTLFVLLLITAQLLFSQEEQEETVVVSKIRMAVSAGVNLQNFYGKNVDGNDLDKKYQAQLRAYIKAFKATTGEDADAMTYHIDI